jgi:hypothetical protein
MLKDLVMRDLRDSPTSGNITVTEAAAVLGVAPGRISQLVLDGTFAGRVEDGRALDVSRRDIRHALGLS